MSSKQPVKLPCGLASIQNEERAIFERRSDIIAGLIEQLKITTTRLTEVEDKLASSEYMRDKLVTDLKSQQSQLIDNKISMAYDPFVLVLIDGDNTLFLDRLVQDKVKGGVDALQLLRQSITGYLKNTLQEQYDFKIIIQVFANIDGLSRTYSQAKVLMEATEFHKFVQNFNMGHTLCDFIDVGNDKEAADSKIKDRMDHFYRNVHCKHIILGASGDDGYATRLRSLTSPGRVNERITLIESRAFPPKLSDLASQFKVVRFDNVFRKHDLLDRVTDHHSKKGSPATRGPPSNASIPSTPCSKRTSGSAKRDVVGSLGLPGPACFTGSCTHRVHLNSNAQRVDLWIKIDWKAIKLLQKRDLCPRHFLSHCTNSKCPLSHDATLTDGEIKALRILARLKPCGTTQCRNVDCIAGHHCLHNKKCETGAQCPFPAKMHNIDTKVESVIA